MKKSVLFFFSTLLLMSSNPSKKKQVKKDKLPNIIHIFADDLGYGDLGCFGATDIKTPNIDRLAKEGMKFTSFYSASSVCSPSRAGLLTGRYPQRMGINQVFFPESFTGMPPEEITIAEMLKQQSYATGIVGKWHLGHREKFLPLQQGFDSYFGIPYSNDMESVVYMRNNEVEDFVVDQRYTTKRYTEEAIHFIDQNRERPFFLYLAHTMPHVPLYASEKFKGSSERGLYGDVIQELDWSVGKVLNKLEALGLLEDTLVIFSSDNGPWLVMEDHGGSAGPLREGKQYTFEGGIRAPTLAMWKGKIAPGTVTESLATQMDWFPTIASLAHTEIPKDRPIDGSDIAPVLLGTGERQGDSFLFFSGAELQGYRKGDWKVKNAYQGFDGNQWVKRVAPHDSLLVNLKKDLGEQNNLYRSQKEKALALFSEMRNELDKMGPLPLSQVVQGDDDTSHFMYLEQKN